VAREEPDGMCRTPRLAVAANSLEECAILAVRQGQYTRAARLAEAAATMRTEIQGTRSFWTAAEDTAAQRVHPQPASPNAHTTTLLRRVDNDGNSPL